MTKEKTMILHLDADAFFVACEVARLPALKGKPVVVGGERGIACAMSYEAKALGITRAMPVFEIKRKYKEVVILPAHFDLYYAYRNNLISFLRERFAKIEVYSIDECFVEVRESELSFTEEALEELRKEIAEFMGISYSLGLADTKTLAKIASKKNKPSGSYYLQKDDEIDFLSKLSLSSLWGIGRRMTKTLTDLELITVGDLLRTSDSLLQKNFSIQLLRTKQELLGIKCYPIEENYAHQKGMQVTRSFARTEDIAFVLSELSTNAEEFCINLQKQNLEVESLEIWIKQVINGKDVHLSKTLLLEEATANHRTLLKAMNSTLSEIRKSKKGIMRGTGIYGKTVPKKRDQTSKLFTTTLDVDTTSILSSIRSNFGNGAIMTLGSMEATNKRRRERDKYDTQSLYLSGLPYPYLGEVR
jgi:nucleotidyltransferase/DNA polymerase involved in DNA repair